MRLLKRILTYACMHAATQPRAVVTMESLSKGCGTAKERFQSKATRSCAADQGADDGGAREWFQNRARLWASQPPLVGESRASWIQRICGDHHNFRVLNRILRRQQGRLDWAGIDIWRAPCGDISWK